MAAATTRGVDACAEDDGDGGTDDDDGMSTPVGDQPTWGSADDRRDPGRPGRASAHGSRGGASPVTVEQLIARQGSAVGRRASRRAEPDPAPAPQPARPSRSTGPVADGPVVRRGLPPVPGAAAGTGGGLPPVPPSGRPLPPAPEPGPRADARPDGDARGIRRSGPLPPLPGGRLAPSEPGHPLRGLGSRPAVQAAGRAARRATATPRRRRLVRLVVALVVLIGLVALYPLGLYFYVDRSMTRVDALATDGPEVLAPQLQVGHQNYLVVGSHVPGEKGAASLALLLASVSADGHHAVLLTVPPTVLVDTPECRTADGRLREPRTEALAASLLDGSPSCAVRAVQEISGLRIDHYLDLDLSRLPGMVDALGGVPVCVDPSAAVSAASRPLPPGGSRVSGTEAAGYLRPADPGSDATGAEVAARAQLLLTSTLRAATSRSSLTSPLALTRFLVRSAGALTVDDGTTLGDLRGLGTTLRDLSGGAVQQAELPLAQVGYTPAGSTQSYVLLDPDATRALFDSVIDRTRLPAGYGSGGPAKAPADAAPAGAGDAAPSPAPTAAPAAPSGSGVSVPPGQVTVDVLNGTATTGLAATAAAALKNDGFGVGSVGNAPAPVQQTVVRYGPGAEQQARTVAAAVPGSVLQADPAAGNSVQLVIGPGYSTVVPVQVAAPATAASAPSVSTLRKPAPPAPCP